MSQLENPHDIVFVNLGNICGEWNVVYLVRLANSTLNQSNGTSNLCGPRNGSHNRAEMDVFFPLIVEAGTVQFISLFAYHSCHNG